MFEIWDILRPLVKLCLYPAMFVAAGGLIFELVFARAACRRHEGLSSKADYRRRLGRAGACRGAGDGRGRQPRWRPCLGHGYRAAGAGDEIAARPVQHRRRHRFRDDYGDAPGQGAGRAGGAGRGGGDGAAVADGGRPCHPAWRRHRRASGHPSWRDRLLARRAAAASPDVRSRRPKRARSRLPPSPTGSAGWRR